MDSHLRLKSELLRGAQPFSIDFGGSTIKLVYICKDGEDANHTLVKFRSFLRSDLHEFLSFIKTEVGIPPGVEADPPALTVTGIGIHEYGKTIEQELNVKLSSTWEGLCNTTAMLFLMKHLGEDQLYHPVRFTWDAAWYQHTKKMAEFLKACGNALPDRECLPPYIPQTWPVLMVTLGSAFTYKVVQHDGSARDVHFSPRGGRMFHGMGSLLTGSKGYEELIDLAKAGNDRRVNTYSSDLVGMYEKKEEDSAYDKLDFDAVSFTFGWAPDKDIADFKREDLAKALLVHVVQQIVADILNICNSKQVTNVVMIGGFVNDPFVREMVESQFHKAQAGAYVIEPQTASEHATCRPLVLSPYLGALGALLHSLPATE